MSQFKVNDEVLFRDNKVIIIEKIQGSINYKKPNKHGGLITGYHRKPCTYKLSSGHRVRGNKLKKINQS